MKLSPAQILVITLWKLIASRPVSSGAGTPSQPIPVQIMSARLTHNVGGRWFTALRAKTRSDNKTASQSVIKCLLEVSYYYGKLRQSKPRLGTQAFMHDLLLCHFHLTPKFLLFGVTLPC